MLHRLGHGNLPGPLRPADPGDRRGQQRGHAGLGGIGGLRPGRALLFTGRHTGTVPRTSDTRAVTARACPAPYAGTRRTTDGSSAKRAGPDTLLSIEELLTEASPGQAGGDH